MVRERKIYLIEFAVIILLWGLVVASPLFFMDGFGRNLRSVHVMWAESFVVGVAFIIHRFILLPSLFFKKRYVAYVVSIILLLLFLALLVLQFDCVNVILSLIGDGDFIPATPHLINNMPPHLSPHVGVAPPTHGPNVIPPMFSLLIASFVVLVLDLGLRIAVTWIISEQRQVEINRERVMAQLQNLQSQVSPHFFMNTLNNIHALVDIEPSRAKQTIIELSDLMSYLLYDCSNKETVSLQRELDFIRSYVHLMRLRFSKQVKVNFSYDFDVPAVNIPPLLFLNFIENAFKYGVDPDRESIIKIRFNFTQTTIEMITINDNYSSAVHGKRSGLGIINSRKRLDLLYGDNYDLCISDEDEIYYVTLKVPI